MTAPRAATDAGPGVETRAAASRPAPSPLVSNAASKKAVEKVTDLLQGRQEVRPKDANCGRGDFGDQSIGDLIAGRWTGGSKGVITVGESNTFGLQLETRRCMRFRQIYQGTS